MPVENRIFYDRDLSAGQYVAQFRQFPASIVADSMFRLCSMNPRIYRMTKPLAQSMCGLALTVKARSGDNLLLHAALDMAEPNDVIVVSNEGGSNRSLLGEIMATYAFFQQKVEGIVLDGPIRDRDAICALDRHLYATGSAPGGPYKMGPGEINVPIACGDIGVRPGDLVLGDSDGVIVIPKEDAAQVLQAAHKTLEKDSANLAAAQRGAANRAWVRQALDQTGVEHIHTNQKGGDGL